MMIRAYLRILARPAFPLAMAGMWFFSLAMSTNGPHRPGEALSSMLDVGLFLGCLLTGLLIGFAVQELQHMMLSWTLPRLRRGVVLGVLATWLLLPALMAGLQVAAGGAISWTTMFLLMATGFGLGLILLDPRGSMAITVAATTAALALALRFFWLVGFVTEQPVIAWALGIAMMFGCGWRALSVATFRHKPFVPTMAMISFLSLPVELNYQRERMRIGRFHERPWTLARIGSGADWVRAAMYESTGFRRFGWLGWHIGWALGLMAMVMGFAVLVVFQDGGGDIARTAWRALVFTSATDPVTSEADRNSLSLAWLISVMWATLILGTSFHLRPRRVYPLSRHQLGRIAFGAGLVHLAVLFVTTGATLSLGAVVLALTLDAPLWPVPMPNFARVIFFSALYMPGLLWLRIVFVRCRPGGPPPLVAMFSLLGVCFLTTGTDWLWAKTLFELNILLELLLFVLMITLSLLVCRAALYRHFTRADLIRS